MGEIHKLKPEIFIQSVEDSISTMSAEYQSDFECYRELQRALNEAIEGLSTEMGDEDRCRDWEDAEEMFFKVKKYLARSNLKWRRNLTQLSDMKKKEEKGYKSGNSTNR